MKQIKSLAIATVAVVGVIATGVGTIHAATNASGQNPMSGLVNAIAQKFNLKAADVQQVFDQQRLQMDQERQAEHAAQQKTRLDQAVKDGTLTQAQEDLIIAKQAELQAARQGLEGKTPSERETAMKDQAAALKLWATTNGIPEQYLMGFGPGGKGEHGGMSFGAHQDPKAMLDQAVKDGKITQAQEDLIVAKQAELKASAESLKDKTPAEREAAMKAQADALKQWATTNNIPEQYVMLFGGRGGRGMGQGGFMGGPRGQRGTASTTPSNP